MKKVNDIPAMYIEGDITAQDSGLISKKLDQLSATKSARVAIDLSETTFIDSYGLGVFVYTWKTLSESGRELLFVNPQALVSNVFTGTNLGQIFHVVESLDAI
jgi:anti-sigma B factor antagonist